MTNSTKLQKWDGKNKAQTRIMKLYDISIFLDCIKRYKAPLGWSPKCLSFAGPKASLERLLVSNKIIKSEDILTIQTYEKLTELHNGVEALESLIRTRNRYLKNMSIWPYNFSSFSACYKLDGCSYPSLSKNSKWGNEYKDFMEEIIFSPAKKFSILDIDICGTFNQKNTTSITNIFNNRLLDFTGKLFLTHQKGRDIINGNMLGILKEYFDKNKYLDMEKVVNERCIEYLYDFARYRLIPIYYICNAFDNNYYMKCYRLVEYRDKLRPEIPAVNMLQYFFEWQEAERTKAIRDKFRKHIKRLLQPSGMPYVKLID